MRRIGLTQRVEVVTAYDERRDCLDQNWSRLLGEAGLVPVPLCNPAGPVPAYLDALELDGVILTGGNDIARLEGARNPAPERDRFEWDLVAACEQRGIPVLGVCRGMQLLNLYRQGTVEPVPGHVRTRHDLTHEGRPLNVNSYHGFGIRVSDLGEGLVCTGECEDGTVEAFRDAGRTWGIMWHPERERPFQGQDIAFLKRIFSAP